MTDQHAKPLQKMLFALSDKYECSMQRSEEEEMEMYVDVTKPTQHHLTVIAASTPWAVSLKDYRQKELKGRGGRVEKRLEKWLRLYPTKNTMYPRRES